MSTTTHAASVAELFADVARLVLADRSVAKTQSERQFLKDAQRSRYGFMAPSRLEELCERSTDPVIRYAIAERLRQHAQQHGHAPLTLGDENALELQETRVQGKTDELQLLRRQDPRNYAITRELCDSLLREEEAARRYRECVELEIPT